MFLRNFTLKVAHAQLLTWKEKSSAESTAAAAPINPECYRFAPFLKFANCPTCSPLLETANSSQDSVQSQLNAVRSDLCDILEDTF